MHRGGTQSLPHWISDIIALVLLHYQKSGQGHPVVILHGLFGSLENWVRISQQLATEFQVIPCDLRNHGASPHSTEMDYDLMAGDVSELLAHEHISPAHIIGHSLGGKIAMQLALKSSHETSALVIVDIAPRAYPPLHREILDALLSIDLAIFRDRKSVEEALSSAIPSLAVRRFLLKSLARTEVGTFRWKLNLQAISDNYAKLNGPVNSDRVCQHPVLVVRGERSDFVSEQDLESMRRLFPNLTAATIPAADHWVHTDAPAAFTALVSEFLRAHNF